jgi:transcription elongation factor Elf1
MVPQYRHVAKQRLAKAIELRNTNDDDDLTYACLELRKSIEALSYDRLLSYLAEVPLKPLAVWQADKVMKELLRIDPTSDKSSHIHVKREAGEDGSPKGKRRYLGEDRRWNTQEASKAYQQLGHFLHVPTIKQSRNEEPPDKAMIRERANEIKAKLQHVLASRIYNVNFSESVTFACIVCEAPIKRQTRVLETNAKIECGNCGQKFIGEPVDERSYSFIPASFRWNCQVCETEQELIESSAKDGLKITCPQCEDAATLRWVQRWELVRDANDQPADRDPPETAV